MTLIPSLAKKFQIGPCQVNLEVGLAHTALSPCDSALIPGVSEVDVPRSSLRHCFHAIRVPQA